MRTSSEAARDVERVLRTGEVILASCNSQTVEPQIILGGGGVQTHFIYVTNARLIWMSANNDGMLCIRWAYMTTLDIGRKRLKHTLTFSFAFPSYSRPMDYPTEFISGDVARTLQDIKSKSTTVLNIPDEFVPAIKVRKPHGSGPIGALADLYGLPEAALTCSFCGFMAGFCSADGDKLLDECEGCLRRFSEIQDRIDP